MGIKCFMSPSSPCHTKFYSYHHSFIFSHATTNLFSTSSPMHTTHHLLPPPIILTTQVPPMNSPYWPPSLHVNLRSQPYTFPIPINNTHVGPFPHLLHQPLQLFMIKPYNLSLSPHHACNFHLKPLAPLASISLAFKG
jgi:hypothetical protein